MQKRNAIPSQTQIKLLLVQITIKVKCYIVGSHPSKDYEYNKSIHRQKDHPNIIISWQLRMNQIKWFYFSIFLTCSYETKEPAILSKILGNLIAITQTSMKRMLAYLSIGQIGYVIIGIIVGDSNDGYASMITYMLFYISMNLGTFAYIVLFGLHIETDNI
ncbi:hypothetical protein CsSME_00031470 [Camellia sinensis var. sinensis]